MFYNTLDRKPHFVKDDIEMVDLGDSIFNTQASNITCAFYKVTKEMEMRPDLMSIAAFGEDSYTEMIMKYSSICNPFSIENEDIIAVPLLNNVYNEVKDYILESGSKGNAIYDLIKNYHKYIDKSKVPSSNGSVESSVRGSKGAGNGILSEEGSLTNQGANTPTNEYSNTFPGTSGGSGTSSTAGSPNSGINGDNGIGGEGYLNPENGAGGYNGSGSGAGGNGSGSGAGGNGANETGDYINYNNGNNNNAGATGAVEPNMANNGNNGISIINGRIYFGPNVSAKASDITDVEGDNSVVNDLVDCAKNGVTIGQFLNATVKNSLKK